MRQDFLMNFSLSLQKIPLSDEITHAVTERLCFFLLLADKLNNESMAFPVNTVCLFQSLRASQRSIKAIDLLHTFILSHASAELSSKIGLFCFSPSDQFALHSLRLPLSRLCVYLPSSRHAQQLQSCILKRYTVSLHEAVSLI